MPKLLTTVIPLGEFAPDAGEFGSVTNRLLTCRNLVPVYGNYCSSPSWDAVTSPLTAPALGLHAISTGPGTYLVYWGDQTALWRGIPVDPPPWSTLDVSRLVGGAYNTSGTGSENGWQFVAFGLDEIATNYIDDVQLLVSGTANFVKLAQSGGGNPGMDPKAKFVGAVRNNLVLANCNLAALYDGLAAGAHPNLVAWSQTSNIRQFGSFNADPQLIGSGYQEILNDFGGITGFVSADDYGIVAQERAFVRMDGPPYQFRSIVTGAGTRFPNALRRFGDDVYGWGPGGPFVLRGGEGPIVYLGAGKLIRTLIDNTTTFSPADSILPGINRRNVSLSIDPTNRLLQYTLTSRGRGTVLGTAQEGNLTVWYNLDEERFSFADSSVALANALHGVLYLCDRPDTGDPWMPGRTAVGVIQSVDDLGSVISRIGTPFYTTSIFNQFPIIRKPYIQLDPELTTRVTRVRPIYASGSAVPVAVSASIAMKNRTYSTPIVAGPYTEKDSHGWVVCPTSPFGDFMQPRLQIGAGLDDITTVTQLESLEIEYVQGPRYAE